MFLINQSLLFRDDPYPTLRPYFWHTMETQNG